MTSDGEERYAMLADAVEAGEYQIVDGSITVHDDFPLGRWAHGS